MPKAKTSAKDPLMAAIERNNSRELGLYLEAFKKRDSVIVDALIKELEVVKELYEDYECSVGDLLEWIGENAPVTKNFLTIIALTNLEREAEQ